MVVLVDEEDRENEGDLVVAADFVTPDTINFMARHARGLVCLTLEEERCRQLGLPLMVSANRSGHGTNFTVSRSRRPRASPPASPRPIARAPCRRPSRPTRARSDLVQPGHIFPVMAQPGGVLVRAGHTEAGCDLARLAGLTPATVICEIMRDDGTMARMPDLEIFAREHGLKIGAITDLIHYRSRTERIVERIAERPLNTPHGAFRLVVYRDKISDATHLALVRGPIAPDAETLVRVHEPLSVMDLLDADSAAHSWTIPGALAAIAKAGRGVVVLLHRPESAAELRERALARRAGAAREDGPAQLRHRRADPARPQRRPHAPPREAAQDAEHGGLRPRGHRLRERAARAAERIRNRMPVKRIAPDLAATALASASCCRASTRRSARDCSPARCARSPKRA